MLELCCFFHHSFSFGGWEQHQIHGRGDQLVVTARRLCASLCDRRDRTAAAAACESPRNCRDRRAADWVCNGRVCGPDNRHRPGRHGLMRPLLDHAAIRRLCPLLLIFWGARKQKKKQSSTILPCCFFSWTLYKP
jgi:hypothetical protein